MGLDGTVTFETNTTSTAGSGSRSPGPDSAWFAQDRSEPTSVDELLAGVTADRFLVGSGRSDG